MRGGVRARRLVLAFLDGPIIRRFLANFAADCSIKGNRARSKLFIESSPSPNVPAVSPGITVGNRRYSPFLALILEKLFPSFPSPNPSIHLNDAHKPTSSCLIPPLPPEIFPREGPAPEVADPSLSSGFSMAILWLPGQSPGETPFFPYFSPNPRRSACSIGKKLVLNYFPPVAKDNSFVFSRPSREFFSFFEHVGRIVPFT